MSSVTIHHRGITILDLSGMVHDDHLGFEGFNLFAWVVLGIRGYITSLDIFHRHVLYIETNIVSWLGFSQHFMMHFYRLAISLYIDRGKEDRHARLK